MIAFTIQTRLSGLGQLITEQNSNHLCVAQLAY